MTKTGFVGRVMSFIQGGDEAKITRFSSKVEKYFSKQIASRKEQIESLNEKITDAEEAFSDQINNVDPSRVGTTENSEDYAQTYVKSLNTSYEAIEVLRERVAEIQKEITRLEVLSSRVFAAE